MPSVQLKREQYNAAFKYVASLIDAGYVAPNTCAQDMFDRVDAVMKLARKVALASAAFVPTSIPVPQRKVNAIIKADDTAYSLGLPSSESDWHPIPSVKMEGKPFPSVLFEL